MARRSQKVNEMKKNFMSLHNSGYSISRIAQKTGVSPATIYALLHEIAEENRLPDRKVLLQKYSRSTAVVKTVEPDIVDVKNTLHKNLSTLKSNVENLANNLADVLND